MDTVPSVTEHLSNAKPGDDPKANELLPLVYQELRALAAAHLSREPARGRAHTLQPTALVHEAFLKLLGSDTSWTGRDHFMAVAAVAMRQILVDHSRKRNADKRGGGRERAEITISDVEAPAGEMQDFDVLRIDTLLTELTALGPRRAQIAEMRLFGGMSIEQIAGVLGCSRMTAHRDWQTARAWLAARCQEPPRA